MEKSLDEKTIELFIPLNKINEIIGETLSYSCNITEDIKKNDSSSYNMAIERSLFKYYPQFIDIIPEYLLNHRETEKYYAMVSSFLTPYLKNGKISIDLIPKKQICFIGKLKDVDCFNLHLANTVEDELYITDIFLQNPKNENKIAQTDKGFIGIGNGVFDEIMLNIEKFAKSENYSKMGLVASNKINMQIFKRRGFVVEKTLLGKLANKLETGYPMVKVL